MGSLAPDDRARVGKLLNAAKQTIETALDALATSGFVGVVTDNRLPGMSGLELYERLASSGVRYAVIFS